MKTISFSPPWRNRGFTLIELIIGMAVLTMLLLATGVFSYNGDQSRATNILTIMHEFGKAGKRYHLDTGAVPKAAWSLYRSDKNLAVDTVQAKDVTASWKGPYIKAFGVDSNGAYKLDAYFPGAWLDFDNALASGAQVPPGVSSGHEVQFVTVNLSLAKQIVAACNGIDVASIDAAYADGTRKNHAPCRIFIPAANNYGAVRLLYLTI